jgi:hypothetical protein
MQGTRLLLPLLLPLLLQGWMRIHYSAQLDYQGQMQKNVDFNHVHVSPCVSDQCTGQRHPCYKQHTQQAVQEWH